MRYIDTIFKGVCVLIFVIATYINRDKLLKSFKSSPFISKSILIFSILGMLLVIGIITAVLIRFI